MISKKSTPLAVLRHVLGPYDGSEDIFASTVNCSVSWVKKASAGLRVVTPKTAHKVSLATGVSEEWLISGDPKAPIVANDNITPYTQEFYIRWRQHKIKPVSQVDPRVVAKFASEIVSSVIAGAEDGRLNTAINDLWKFSKMMRSRYGEPKDMCFYARFSYDVSESVRDLAGIEANKASRNPSGVFPDNS